MPKRKILPAEKRKILGRKVKKLRGEGILPANIYGKNIASTAVQVGVKEFEKFFSEVGETEVIDLQVGKEKEKRPVLIRDVQVDPVTDNPLHVDFMQVVLTEKVEAAVPIVFVGEAPAVKEGRGILLELINELEVEALPTDLPSKIEVDISKLKDVGEGVSVEELKLPKKVEVKTEKEELVCKIEAPETPVEAPPEAPVEEEKPATPLRPPSSASGGLRRASEGQAAETLKGERKN
ncbi:MAG: 50S ribosomal protein L25 [Candidatus Cloacimonetes bacterium]|nr:50S ribosomal protein L25 [Candidatus Cloacimonadota bacterium]